MGLYESILWYENSMARRLMEDVAKKDFSIRMLLFIWQEKILSALDEKNGSMLEAAFDSKSDGVSDVEELRVASRVSGIEAGLVPCFSRCDEHEAAQLDFVRGKLRFYRALAQADGDASTYEEAVRATFPTVGDYLQAAQGFREAETHKTALMADRFPTAKKMYEAIAKMEDRAFMEAAREIYSMKGKAPGVQ